MASFLKDLQFGWRLLRTRPGITLVAVVTIALGIGINTALFSVLDTVLLRPLDYPQADRLAMVWQTDPERGETEGGVSLPDFFDWQRETDAFSDLTSYVRWQYNVLGSERPDRVWGAMVSHRFFEVFGVPLERGRGFEASEDQPGADKVAIIGHGLWQGLFAGDPEVVGKTLRIDDNPHRIVGVAPAGFQYPKNAQLWTPLALGPDSYPRSLHFMHAVGRLADGESLPSAQEEMSAVAAALGERFPDTNGGRGIRLVEVRRQLVGDVRPALVVLAAASGFLLLIACTNVVNLLLSRAAARRREIAVRRALGATPGRLIRQLLTEGLMLAIAGGALGLALAHWVLGLLIAFGPQDVPRLAQAAIDGRALFFTLGLCLLTTLIVSLIPVLQLYRSRDAGREALAGGRALGGAGRRRLQAGLVVAQVAIALPLVVGAGLMVRSFDLLRQVDTGFRSSGVLTMELALPWSKYTQVHETAGFYAELLETLNSEPNVESAGALWTLPLSGGATGNADFTIQSGTISIDEELTARVQAVSGEVFDTLGIPLLQGRRFSSRDDAEAPPVVIVNETFAQRYWPDGDPIGDRLTFDLDFGPVGNLAEASREIVGVVGDFKTADLQSETPAEIYFPYRQATWRMMSVVVRHRSGGEALANRMRQAVWAIDSAQPVSNLKSLDSLRGASLARPKFNALLLSLFAGLALVLSAIGIFGVISYSVSRRAREIGLRMALGAQRGRILKQILMQGLKLSALGLGLGVLAALALTRLLSSLLFGVTATDPMTFVAVAVAVLLLTALAAFFPARRAMGVDPMNALRHD